MIDAKERIAEEIKCSKEEFLKSKVVLNGTTFQINKLNAYQAHKLLKYIEVHIIEKIRSFEASENFAVDVICALLSVPEEQYEHIQKAIFGAFRYCLPTDKHAGALPLLEPHLYELAFQHLNPYFIEELLVRGLFVNFFSSFQTASERFPALHSLTKHLQPND